ncbi:hypothetical protein V5F89_05520 [Pelagerythrobacter marensis]|uniref:Anti-sigma factor n=1 Tax=Pelagerythrobacter marensis TaxID=543877 RepID=A0ABZ2DC31_9SPHN
MQQTQDRAVSPEERRLAIEASVARYPALDEAELKDVLHWFRKEATAYEAAMFASNEALAEPYRRLRDEHLDRLSPREKAAVWIVGALLLSGIAALYIML